MASTARFDELKKKFDENPRRYFAPLANEFRKSGDAAQAVMICEEFLPQQPGHMSGHIVYGQALFDLGRLDDARTVFETALTLDPENLIALRHLGDIARSHGDPESARHWYQRVLDADPRNEEVQALIADLDAGGAAPAAHSESAPAESTSVEVAANTEPVPMADLAVAFQSSSESPVSAPPPLPPQAETAHALLELDMVEEQVIAVPPPSRSAAEDAPFDSISLEGLEPTSAGTAASERPRQAEGFEPMEFAPLPTTGAMPGGIADQVESGEFTAPSSPVEPLAGLEESAVGAFEARTEADRVPELPHVEPTLPEVDDRATDQPPVDIPPEVIAAEAELIEARESPQHARAESSAPAEPPALPELADTEPAAPPSEPVAHAQPALRATPSQPFVTETMAELYVKQGFREQALDVYKLLLAASPDSQRLRERVAELQAPVEPDSGPNVREFFARLAARRPGDGGAAAEPPASDDFASFESFETVAVEESAQQEQSPREAQPASPPPAHQADERADASGSEVGEGSIDALFGQRPVGPADASAASALAQAFGGGQPEPPPITGRPARAAAGELSLDSVFRDGGARPPRSAQSFSFDQFFSESATAERPPEPEPTQTPSQGTGAQSAPPERSADDIEQFNSWLQGLKQR